jgi:hypothetical protein
VTNYRTTNGNMDGLSRLGDVWGYGSLDVDRLYLKEGRVDVSVWLVWTAPD